MQTFKNIQDETMNQAEAAETSTALDRTRVKTITNDSYIWACALFNWGELRDAKKRTATNDGDGNPWEYYTYPDTWRSDSITKLKVGGVKYDPKDFDTLEDEKDNPTGITNVYADYGRRYFLWPVPVAGTLIEVWGQNQPTALVEDADVTIFSSHDNSGNEAIISKNLSVIFKKSDPKFSKEQETSAINLLSLLFDKVGKHQQKNQLINKPFISIPNLFGRRISRRGMIEE